MKDLFKHITYVLIAIICLSSCRGNKKVIGSSFRSDKEIKKAITDHNIDYQWFTTVGKIKMSTPNESISAKVYLRVQRDTAIWMVVKKLGVEVARALITPDEFTIIYRWEKVYEQESLQTLMDSYDASLSFPELQDYIIGNIPEIDTDNFESRLTDKEVICQTHIVGNKSFLKLDLDKLLLRSFEMFNDKNESVKGEFTNFKEVEEHILPFKRTFYIRSVEHGDLKAELNLSEIQIDQPKTMKFSIPPHYEKLKYYRPF